VAIVDLRGEVLKTRCSKNFSLKSIVQFISRECNPLIIASDVTRAPRLLEKVAASFSVPLQTPKKKLSRRNKSMILKSYGLKVRESHRMDALAAALKAYESVHPLMGRIKKKIKERKLSRPVGPDDVARMIITGECSNIRKAISSLVKGTEPKSAFRRKKNTKSNMKNK
jgi:predicted RNase H-like nuclease (RuvC/YqgF family)